MMEGVLSGKTGYTNDAGYCYAGALSKEDITLAAVVLGSGWPPHKTRKWTDTKTLMNHGLNYYSQSVIGERGKMSRIELPVRDGTVNTAMVHIQWFLVVAV